MRGRSDGARFNSVREANSGHNHADNVRLMTSLFVYKDNVRLMTRIAQHAPGFTRSYIAARDNGVRNCR